MAGIYIHIPFCKSRCIYCDFYSGINLQLRDGYTQAIIAEAKLRTDYLNGEAVETIYFGGGTPSQLSPESVGTIISELYKLFHISYDAEITLEANPSDITMESLSVWKQIGVNRLSIGVQSFNDDNLRFIGRRHNSTEAIHAVQLVQQSGFDNVSIDLMYGLPQHSVRTDVDQAVELGVKHISTYCLTYEEGTKLFEMLQDGRVVKASEEEENELFECISSSLSKAGYEHYEVSNFALQGYRSRHNSSYWTGVAYLGLGAAAHSYNRHSRQWNVADTEKYISSVESMNLLYEKEELSTTDMYNELIMLSLRTKEGIDLDRLSSTDRSYCLQKAQPYIEKQKLQLFANQLTATADGLKILNLIITDLMQ